MKNLFTHLVLSLLILSIYGETYSQNFWQPTNGPQGGIYRDITTNLTTGKTYLLTHWNRLKGNGLGGNIYISSDNGTNWTEIDNGLNGLPVYGIAHSSVNENLVISVMSPTSPLSAANPNQIYFSNNNGSTWNVMNSSYFAGNLPPNMMLFNSNADTIYAGQKTNGISYSKDNGASWQTMNTGITNKNITDLEYGYQGKLYCSTDSVSGNGGKVFVKNGTTWSDVSSGLPNTRVNDLYYDAPTNTMYLGTTNLQLATGAIYKSVNGGSWTQVLGYPGAEVSKILTAPNGDILVRVLKQGVWRYSSNRWSAINTNLNSLRTSGFTKDNSGNILLTTSAGIWKFNDLNNSWSYFTNGIINTQGRAMAFSKNGDLIVGTDNGIYKSTDGGNSWNHSGLTDTVMMSVFHYKPDGRMFAGNTDNTASHVFVSTDNGSSWKINETGFSSTRTSDFASNSKGKLFVGTGWQKPIHASIDGVNWNGPNWSSLGFSSNTVVIAVAIDATDRIYVGTESQGVLRSVDNGISYQWVGFTGGDVTDIQITPNQDVFVAHDIFSGNGNGALYRSSNGGTSWSANLMPSHGLTNCILIASSDSIYVGTTSGVWLSIDTGNSWSLLNMGLNPGNVVIHTLELSPDGYLYAGTGGAGIYRSVNKIKGKNSIKVTYSNKSIDTVCMGAAPIILTGGTPEGGIYSGKGVSNGIFNASQAGIGSFIITYTFTDNQGLTSSDSGLITVVPKPNISFSSSQKTICINDASVTLTGGNPTGGIYVGKGVANGIFNPTVTGAGGIMIMYIYTNKFGCSNSDSFLITVLPRPSVTYKPTLQTNFCTNDAPTALTGGNPIGGVYSGKGIENGMFNPAVSGVGEFKITYLYTDKNGCSNSDSILITVSKPTTSSITLEAVDSFSLNGQTYTQSGVYTQVIQNADGCDSTITLSLKIISTGVTEQKNESGIIIYPNPSKGGFIIEQGSGIATLLNKEIEIFTILGEKIYTAEISALKTVITFNFNKGLYLYHIKDKLHTIQSGKLFIQ
ncbi:MAG: T9SS type A sorting domain-containing protein [Bacteroidetes bacterium]|nr:T9SS type A sorting domain-containing protein [Bacteroidota bacterium]